MSLRETLTGIVSSVEGGVAAIVMAYDGISIDEAVARTDFDLQLLTVEYATLLKDIKRAVEILKVGDLEEVSITTGQLHVAIRVLNADLFVVLVMTRDGNHGKGRYLLKLKSFDLLQELG